MRRLALALLLVFAASSCISQKQWERFRSHGSASLFATAMGGLAVAIGGPAGLAVFGGGVVGGVVIDQTLEPEPEVHTQTVTTVVVIPSPLPDGSPAKPRVSTYVDKSPDEKPPDLNLPGGFELPRTWTERAWLALQTIGWALLALAVLVFVVRHPKVRSAAWGSICFVVAFLWHKGSQGIKALKSARARPPTQPPEDP